MLKTLSLRMAITTQYNSRETILFQSKGRGHYKTNKGDSMTSDFVLM